MKSTAMFRRTAFVTATATTLLFTALNIGLLSTGVAHADALSDLRIKLKTLNADTSLQATLEVQSVKVSPKQDDAAKSEPNKLSAPAQIQLQINVGDGLGIHIGQILLQKLAVERQANAEDPEQLTPTLDLLRQVSPVEVERMVSAAPDLLLALDGAESPTLKPARYDGATVRQLGVILPLQASKKERSNISDYQGYMTLWLDAKGMPLGYQQTFHAKFCKFFLCLKVDQTRTGKLRDVAGRLVTMSYTDETRQSGLGQDGDNKKIYTLILDNSTDAQASR